MSCPLSTSMLCNVLHYRLHLLLKLLLLDLDSIHCVQVVLILCWCFKKPIASRSSNSCFLLILIKWRYWSNSFHSNSSNIFLVVTTTICNGIFLHIIAEIGNKGSTGTVPVPVLVWNSIPVPYECTQERVIIIGENRTREPLPYLINCLMKQKQQ